MPKNFALEICSGHIINKWLAFSVQMLSYGYRWEVAQLKRRAKCDSSFLRLSNIESFKSLSIREEKIEKNKLISACHTPTNELSKLNNHSVGFCEAMLYEKRSRANHYCAGTVFPFLCWFLVFWIDWHLFFHDWQKIWERAKDLATSSNWGLYLFYLYGFFT